MDHIKNLENKSFETVIIWNVTWFCQLDCSYCFENDLKKEKDMTRTLDYKALAKTLDMTDTTCLLVFSGGGEPFLVKNILETAQAVTKNHYIAFNTNLISPCIPEFAKTIDPTRVDYIHASLHLRELERKRLLDRFIDHYRMLADNGFEIYAKTVFHPDLNPDIERYQKYFSERGVEILFQPFFGTHEGQKYPDAYTADEVTKYNLEELGDMNTLGKICSGGKNLFFADYEGNVRPCHSKSLSPIRGNLFKSLRLNNYYYRCPIEFCGCKFLVDQTDRKVRTLKKTHVDRIRERLMTINNKKR